MLAAICCTLLLGLTQSVGRAASIGGCSGMKVCPPRCNSRCTDGDADCHYLCVLPGTEVLGHAVDISLYSANLVDTQTTGTVHLLSDAVLPTSLFNDSSDFANLFDRQVGGETVHYVLPFSAKVKDNTVLTSSETSFSNSVTSSSSSYAMHAGLDAKYSFVSVSASMSASGSSTKDETSFCGTSKAFTQQYSVILAPDATFTSDLLNGVGDYDGSATAQQKYKSLFDDIGLYYVSEVAVGGAFQYQTTIATSNTTDASKWKFDFDVKVSFVKVGGGGQHSDTNDEYNKNQAIWLSVLGGDGAYNPKMASYVKALKDETIDTTNFQKDYAMWLGSIGSQPGIVDIKVEHISKRFTETGSMTKNQRITVDNLAKAYDEIQLGLRSDAIKIVRVQYGVKNDFETPPDPSQLDAASRFIELPTDIGRLPYDAKTNAGFSTQYDPTHSCPSAQSQAKLGEVGRTLRYKEHCDPETNLLKCDGLPWCDLLTTSNMGKDPDGDKALNAELVVRLTFTAGVGNGIQTIDFKPCGHGAAWAIYWNEHHPYAYERQRGAKIVGPRYDAPASAERTPPKQPLVRSLRAAVALRGANSTSGNQCNPEAAGGCNVCADCCNPYLIGGACDSCVAGECPKVNCNPESGPCTCASSQCCNKYIPAEQCEACNSKPCGADDPCAHIDCGSHGACSAGNCTCSDGFTGPTCDRAPRQWFSDLDKDLFPCTAANNMGGFAETEDTDPACCDSPNLSAAYKNAQQVGCPDACSGHGTCIFPAEGPLHCECDPGWVGAGGVPNCSLFCDSDVCSGHGHCVGDGPLTCECEKGWISANCSLVDPCYGTWCNAASMGTGRGSFAATVMGGMIYALGGDSLKNSHNVYPIGLKSCEGIVTYKKGATWQTVADMGTPRLYFAAAADVPSGKIYAIGGGGISTYTPLKSVEVYDVLTKAWAPVADMVVARANLGAVAVGGKIYAIGGYDQGLNHNYHTTEIYDPKTNTWDRSYYNNMVTARERLAVAAVDGKIYAIGGKGLKSVEMLDTASTKTCTNSACRWEAVADMSTERYGHAAVVVDKKIYVMGGYSGHDMLKSVEVYDPVTNTWTPAVDMKTARASFGAAVGYAGSPPEGGKIYAFGGAVYSSRDGRSNLNSVEVYDP